MPIYSALINAGANAGDPPAVTIKVNTLPGAIVWTYSSMDWIGTLTGAFTNALLQDNATQTNLTGIGYTLPFDHAWQLSKVDANTVKFQVFKTSDFTQVDPFDVLASNSNIPIQIKTY